MAVYLLLGDDEERKARGVEKARRGREAESFEASEATPEAVVSACNSYSLFGDGPSVSGFPHPKDAESMGRTNLAGALAMVAALPGLGMGRPFPLHPARNRWRSAS